ncbi:hypothetical protein FKB34_02445 [Glycocaulis profundi]|nr:hypothetical protein FKB34_02445 [Glycocaulis profundi]
MTLKGKLKVTILAIAVIVAGLAWITAGAAFFLDAPRAAFLTAIIVAALATEGVFWLGALVLGWTMFDNRRALIARVFGRGSAANG